VSLARETRLIYTSALEKVTRKESTARKLCKQIHILDRIVQYENTVKNQSSEMNMSLENETRSANPQSAADNWRFGASGGVAPRKVQWEIERL